MSTPNYHPLDFDDETGQPIMIRGGIVKSATLYRFWLQAQPEESPPTFSDFADFVTGLRRIIDSSEHFIPEWLGEGVPAGDGAPEWYVHVDVLGPDPKGISNKIFRVYLLAVPGSTADVFRELDEFVRVLRAEPDVDDLFRADKDYTMPVGGRGER